MSKKKESKKWYHPDLIKRGMETLGPYGSLKSTKKAIERDKGKVKSADVKGRKKGKTESMKAEKRAYNACVKKGGGTIEAKTSCAKKHGGGR
jgi:hypothetical protein